MVIYDAIVFCHDHHGQPNFRLFRSQINYALREAIKRFIGHLMCALLNRLFKLE